MITSIPRDKSDVCLIILSQAAKMVLESSHQGVEGFLVEAVGMRPQVGYFSVTLLSSREFMLIDRQLLCCPTFSGRRMNWNNVLGSGFKIHGDREGRGEWKI